MALTAEQQRAIIRWAERTAGVLEVRLFGSRVTGNSPSDTPVSLAVTTGGVGIGDPFTLYFSEQAKWNAELMNLLGLPTRVYWYDPKGAPKVYSLCQEASTLIYSRHAQ